MNSVLSLQQVTRQYQSSAGPLDVLKDVNLELKAGELVALIGPSGSGKSTLLHIAGLLDTPQSGAIFISGVDASHANDRARTRLRNQHIGFIYQFHNLLPELSALENVAIPQAIAGVKSAAATARARELLVRLGLEHRLDHLPSQLSGGEQQRVAIARALANKPALILADEPTGNLDPTTSESVTALLLEIAREEQVAALIATHNMTLAKRLTRAVTLRDGKIHVAQL
ncbi:MAG: ABC transporter ATP-binding protein [Pseudomonadota bacterium]